jgi:hypothetical protein
MLPCTTRFIPTLFVEIVLEELDWPAQSPDLNPHGMNWNADCPTSVPDLTSALVAEWKQTAAAMFQHLVEAFPEERRLL